MGVKLASSEEEDFFYWVGMFESFLNWDELPEHQVSRKYIYKPYKLFPSLVALEWFGGVYLTSSNQDYSSPSRGEGSLMLQWGG